MAKKRKTQADYEREWAAEDARRASQFQVPARLPASAFRVAIPRTREDFAVPSRVRAPEEPVSLSEMLPVVVGGFRNLPQGLMDTGKMLGDFGKFAGEQALLSVKDRFTGSDEAYQHLANSPTFNAMVEHAKEHPVNAALDWVPLVGDAKGVGDMIREAALARRHGNMEDAAAYEGGLLPSVVAGLIPEGGALAVRGIANRLRPAREAADLAVRAVEAPAIHTHADPEVKSIKDWQWRPFEDVRSDLSGLSSVPPHVVDFGRFMQGQSAKAAGSEGLSPRDLLKAYGITRSSIQRQALPLATAEKYGADLAHLGLDKVRPEGAFAELLGTPEGQAYLDEATRGQVNRPAIDAMMEKFTPFGFQNTLGDDLEWAVSNLPQHTSRVSDMVAAAAEGASDPSEWTRFVRDNVSGVNAAKAGFVGSMLGRGDLPTLDARQIILNTGMPTSAATKYLARKEGAVEGVQRLASRMAALGLTLPEDLQPYYQHLAHHSVWDKAGDEVTTHADLINAMKNFSHGGLAVKKGKR